MTECEQTNIDCLWKRSQPIIRTPNQYKSFQSLKRQFPRYRNVCGACVISNNRILLVKQREVQKWGLPKGSREYKESKLSCMNRELQEETGLVLENYRHSFLGTCCFFECTIYFIELEENNPDSIVLEPIDTNEIDEVKWVRIDQLKDYDIDSLNRITNHIKRTVFSKPQWKGLLLQNQLIN
jgi:8-oxo-dGTP pyrophosphatase MutT (NUDIX family)